MSNKTLFKYLIMAMFAIAFASILKSLSSTSLKQEQPAHYQVQVSQASDAARGLNLQAVGELLKEAKTAEEFEKLLNDPKRGVNNLDLNGDGMVDYLKVREFGEGDVRGFSLTTEAAPGKEQEIASIKVAKQGDERAVVEYHGNPSLYGPGHYYQSQWGGLASGLIMGYLFGRHRPFSSPFSSSYHPPYYQPYSRVSPEQYAQRHRSMIPEGAYKRSLSGQFEHVASPYHNAQAGKNPLAKGVSSQKAFSERRPAMKARQGGFGRSRSGGFRRR